MGCIPGITIPEEAAIIGECGDRGTGCIPGNPDAGVRGTACMPGNPDAGVRGTACMPGNPDAGVIGIPKTGDLRISSYSRRARSSASCSSFFSSFRSRYASRSSLVEKQELTPSMNCVK
jgi:hypothetical protein